MIDLRTHPPNPLLLERDGGLLISRSLSKTGSQELTSLGFGIGLRPEHYTEILADPTRADWYEAISENYMDTGGRPQAVLEHVRRDRPVALHGVGLSIGSTDPLDRGYLRRLRALVDRIEPTLVTDHCCWTGAAGRPLYDLLPVPYTEEALRHVVERVGVVQEYLGRRIALENPSTYVAFHASTMSEPEFLAALAEEADCLLLLDVNNVYVSAHNLGFDPDAYLQALPADRVAQFHLAGFTDMGTYLFDTHSAPVHPEVWRLYRRAVRLFGAVPTLIEWDADIPPLERLCAEAEQARAIAEAEAKVRLSAPAATPGCQGVSLAAVQPTLGELQQSLASLIVSPADGVHADDIFRVPPGVALGERLSVYVNGYPARLREALVETFPAVTHLLSCSGTTALVTRYVAACPPLSYNLNHAGAQLPAFLRADELGAELPFLADLAELEWLLSCAFHATREAALEPAEVVAIAPDAWAATALRFQPGVAVATSEWPIHDIWAARDTPIEDIDLDLVGRPQSILVYRTDLQTRCEPIGAEEAATITALLAGRVLGDIFEEMDVAPRQLREWFARWMGVGLLAAF